MSKTHAATLDKYYTRLDVAKACYERLKPYLTADTLLIEPSAGGGAFLNVGDHEIVGFDLAPEHPAVIKNDFIETDPRQLLCNVQLAQPMAAIGNPPFGRKSALGIQFLNLSLKRFGLVGLIVPIQFRKWSVQSKIDPLACLLVDDLLDPLSFLFMGKPYQVRCCFQIWTMSQCGVNLRQKIKPSIHHDDFEMWQFNRTDGAMKYFDYDWDFAVPRQGYQDYTFKAFRKDECDRKKQWIFFKAHSEDALERLLALDFEKLSLLNTGIPGFGKADVVEAYLSDLR